MKKMSNKGFTMIELMIVIAVIGLLSVVLIPKVRPLKDAAKINAVEANVFIVRSFLENRGGAYKKTIDPLLETTSYITNALNLIKNDIGTEMNTKFSGSSTMKNPFNNATTIDISTANVALNINVRSSSVIIGYDVNSIPTDISSITSTITTPGVTVIIVYRTGYVVYGIDNFGGIVQPTLINMPKTGATLPGIINPPIPQVAAPNFDYTYDKDGGIYTISCVQADAIIRYTVDGSQPDSTSAIYDADVPMPLKSTTTLKAYATYSGLMDSNVSSTIFTLPIILPVPTPPVITPSFSFSGDFGAENIIVKGEDIIFSIEVTPSDLGGTMIVTVNDGTIKDNKDGTYTFEAPNGNGKVCTIIATLTTIDGEQFVGQIVLTTTNK